MYSVSIAYINIGICLENTPNIMLGHHSPIPNLPDGFPRYRNGSNFEIGKA